MKYLNGLRVLATIVFILLAGSLVFPVGAQAPSGFTDSFDDPSLPGWESSPEVTAVDGVLRVPAPGFAFALEEWHDLTLSVQIRLVGEGEVLVHYRAAEAGNYHVLVGHGYIILFREMDGVVTEMGSSSSFEHPASDWFKLGVEAVVRQ